jgi:hypothetical protein
VLLPRARLAAALAASVLRWNDRPRPMAAVHVPATALACARVLHLAVVGRGEYLGYCTVPHAGAAGALVTRRRN